MVKKANTAIFVMNTSSSKGIFNFKKIAFLDFKL